MKTTIPLAQTNGQQILVRCSERPYRVKESPNATLLPPQEQRDEHVGVKT